MNWIWPWRAVFWLSFGGYFWLTRDVKQFRNYCGLTKIARCGFSWRKTTKMSIASRISCSAAPVERSDVRLSSRKAACSSVAPPKLHRKSGFSLHQLRKCLAVRARNAAKGSSQELLCCVTFIRVISVCPRLQGCKGREVHHPKRRTAQVAVTVTFRLSRVFPLGFFP
jgi:hypothetical protein